MTADHEALRQRAVTLDRNDPLAGYRAEFVIADENLIYFDGNSLGRLPRVVEARLRDAIEVEWGSGLIRGWNQGWWDSSVRVGERIGALLGAAPGQVLASDQTSLNLFKLASAALGLRPRRTRILTDSLNFPSDLYVLQGLVRLLGNRHNIVRIGSPDGDRTERSSSVSTGPVRSVLTLMPRGASSMAR